ncbi:hypothetical protein [Infirmifilum uzonense]|uniref:hypothetical protein n=1 Tax=Infirmifilum uzonense TaxID=1550241 RepID=UPI000B06627C|nr:hypothetical protein [Infirmifilum uzonense]
MSTGKPRCKICGSENVVAKIEGEYYCAVCGMQLVLDHSRVIVENYEKKFLKP